MSAFLSSTSAERTLWTLVPDPVQKPESRERKTGSICVYGLKSSLLSAAVIAAPTFAYYRDVEHEDKKEEDDDDDDDDEISRNYPRRKRSRESSSHYVNY